MASTWPFFYRSTGHTATSGTILQGRRLFMMWLYIFPDITITRRAPLSSHGEKRRANIKSRPQSDGQASYKSLHTGCKHTTTRQMMQIMPDLFVQIDGPRKVKNSKLCSRINPSSPWVNLKRGPRCPEISRALPCGRVSEAQSGVESGRKLTERLMPLGPYLPEF